MAAVPGFTPINIPNIQPVAESSVTPLSAAALSARTGSVADLMKGLQPNPDLSQVQADPNILNALANINAPKSNPIDFTNFANSIQNPSPSKNANNGNSDWLGQLLNNTVEQPAGLIRTALGNAIDNVKNDWTSNAPWWQKIGNTINDTMNPLQVGKDFASAGWQGIQGGMQQEQKDWQDKNASWWSKAGGGFLDGMSNSWTTGTQIDQKIGLSNALDKVANNSDLQQNPLQWWANAGNDLKSGNILGGLGNALGGATLGGAGLANQLLAKTDGTWVNKIPLLGQLPMMSDSIMHMNPNGHQGIDQVAGLLTEIGLDPLTYLDGAGLATKIGKNAELDAMSKVAQSEGLGQKFGDMQSFSNALKDKFSGEADAAQQMEQLNRSKQIAQNFNIDPATISHPNDLLAAMEQKIGQAHPNSTALPVEPITADTLKGIQNELDNTGNIHQRLADQKIQGHLDTVNAARADAANGALNKIGLSFPFSNATIPIAKMPAKIMGVTNPLFRSEATLGDKNVHLAQGIIDDMTKNDSTKSAQLENAIKQRYNISDLKDMTKTQFGELRNKLQPYMDKTGRPISDATVEHTMKEVPIDQNTFNRTLDEVVAGKVPWKDVQKQLEEVINQTGHDPALRSSMGSHLAQMVSDYWKNKPNKNFSGVANARKAESMQWVANWLHQSDKTDAVESKITDMYTHGNPKIKDKANTANFKKVLADLQDSKYTKVNNAKTPIDHFFEGKNPFNGRTLQTNDKFTNSLANHIQDMASARIGLKAQYGQPMSAIEKYIKDNGITDKEMTDTIYHLEGQAPKSYDKNWTPSDRVNGLANLVKPVLDKVAGQEQKAGVLDQIRQNYFPHILNNSEDAQKFKDFVDKHPELSGVNSTNKFNQERTGFQTMADAQDHLDSLSSKMAQTTDPAELKDLQDQFDRVRNMFDQNIPTALTSRIKSGVQAMVNKEMQGEFKKFGAVVSNPTDVSKITPNMVKLDANQANKFGLGKGQHYMDGDVLKGLERVDQIFTAKGMDKFVRNVQAITDIFRSSVTTFKFSHYRNNIIGNVINNMAAGVGLRDYTKAGQMLQKMRAGTLSPAEQAIIDSAYKHNVINGGFVNDMMHGGGIEQADPTALEKIAKTINNWKAAKNMRSGMEKIDDVSRLGNYINGLKKFGDEEKAANQVRTYHFNYNEMTNADRHMRTIVPFWNWMKRNIPLQLKNIVERPAIAVNFEKTKNQFNNNQQGADWQKDSGIKIPGLSAYTTLPSPTDDLKQFGSPLQTIGSINPVAKMLIELAANRNIYTGNPISFGSKTTKMQDIPGYVAKNFGVANDIGSLGAAAAGQGKKSMADIISNYMNPETPIVKGRATKPIQP